MDEIERKRLSDLLSLNLEISVRQCRSVRSAGKIEIITQTHFIFHPKCWIIKNNEKGIVIDSESAAWLILKQARWFRRQRAHHSASKTRPLRRSNTSTEDERSKSKLAPQCEGVTHLKSETWDQHRKQQPPTIGPATGLELPRILQNAIKTASARPAVWREKIRAALASIHRMDWRNNSSPSWKLKKYEKVKNIEILLFWASKSVLKLVAQHPLSIGSVTWPRPLRAFWPSIFAPHRNC